MRGLYAIYKSRDTRAKPECQGFMNRVQTELWFITIYSPKYCVLSRYVASNYINVFPANTFFNDAYQTISDIQFIATGRVAPVTGYKYKLGYVKRGSTAFKVPKDGCGVPSAARALLGPEGLLMR